jgi:hypothetical protein
MFKIALMPRGVRAFLSKGLEEGAFYLTGSQHIGHPDGGVDAAADGGPGQVGAVGGQCGGDGDAIEKPDQGETAAENDDGIPGENGGKDVPSFQEPV